MNIDFDELKNVTDEALMISMIKMLVFQELKDKPRINEHILKDKINTKPNEFYKPEGLDIKTQNNFNVFIKKLADKILEETKTDDKNAYV